MPRPAILAAALLLAAPAGAQGVFVPPPGADPGPPLTGKRLHVARELPFYGFDAAELRGVSNAKVALIDSFIHSNRSHGTVRAEIASALRGGLLDTLLDRF